MLYTNFGRIVAGLALLFGILFIVVGLMVATGMMMVHPGSSWSSAHAIDRGTYTVLLGVALGILTEISRSVHPNRAA